MTPNFIRTIVPERETLGEKLAKKRAALGYDIKETEKATRIRAKYVEYIEAGNYEKLPPDVYVQGFLKNYSAFLKLDPDKVIRLYKKERGLKEKVKKVTAPIKPKKGKKMTATKVLITPSRLIIGGTAFAALGIILFISVQVWKLAAPPKLTVANPTDNIKIENDSLVVEGKTDAGADVFINDIPIGVDPEGVFKEKISLQEGVNLVKVSAKNKLNKVTLISRTVLANLPSLASAPKNATGLTLRLDVGPGSASYSAEADGKQVEDKNNLMLPGSSKIITATDKITLSVSDGGSVRVTLNGKDMGTLGKPGEKITNKVFSKT